MATPLPSTIAIVSNTSPEINYAGDWFSNGTNKVTTKQGSSLTFSYNGTKMWVSGTFYPLDGKKPWSVTFAFDNLEPLSLVGQDVYQTQTDAGLWESPDSTAFGQHELSMKVTSASNDVPFLLDQLLYAPASETSRPQVTYSATAPPQVTVTVTPDATSTPGSSVPVGAIAGGVAAGVVVLVVAGLLAFWFYRKRRQPKKPYYYETGNPSEMLREEDSGVALFNDKDSSPRPSAGHDQSPSPPTSQNGHHSPQNNPSAHSIDPTLVNTHDFTITPYRPIAAPAATSFSNAQAEHSHTPPSPRVDPPSPRPGTQPARKAGLLAVPEPQATYHEDSGIRFGGPSPAGEDDPPPSVDVPPTYTPN